MDPRRFDSIIRTLAAPKSRRGILGACAALVAGLAAGREAGATQAVRVGVCHRSGNGSYRYIEIDEHAVPAHAAHGDATRVDLATDPLHCGACGNVCAADEICVGGACGGGPGALCGTSAECAGELCCHEGSCRAAQATLVDCGGQCDDPTLPASVTICGATAICPSCTDCAALGCDAGQRGEAPVTGVHRGFCVYRDGTGSCYDSVLQCPTGSGCFGLACLEICTGA